VAFFQSQAGIAWAMDWQASGDPQSLAQARDYAARGVKRAPENAIYWANLAVLDWHSGQPTAALDDIRQAIQLSPGEPSFPLNYGWFLEQSGQPAAAEAQYQRALELDPGSAAHPFWQSSPVRKAAVAGVKQPVSAALPYWQTARQDVAARQFTAARQALALGSVYEEPALAIDAGWGRLHLHQGNTPELSARVAAIENDLDFNYWGLSRIHDAYNYYYSRNFQRMVVPGYLRLSADYGQLDLLAQQSQMQIAAGGCTSAARAWAIFQREQHSGALIQVGYPLLPACVEQSNKGG
jgi:tetratricopeptide (TPR) repeat protein